MRVSKGNKWEEKDSLSAVELKLKSMVPYYNISNHFIQKLELLGCGPSPTSTYTQS